MFQYQLMAWPKEIVLFVLKEGKACTLHRQHVCGYGPNSQLANYVYVTPLLFITL